MGLWTLARDSGLDENSPYAYLMWAEYFAATSVVATTVEADTPVGFVTGFRLPEDPSTVFVWQIGVDADHRGQGIASRLLDALVERTDAAFIEATVTPDNLASETLFRRLGDRHGATTTVTELFAENQFPPGHEAEHRFRIGPLSSSTTDGTIQPPTSTFPEGDMP